MKTKSKKSIESLKKQKVDGKKVKGGNIVAGHLHGGLSAAEGNIQAGNIHSNVGVRTLKPRPTGSSGFHSPLASDLHGNNDAQ